VLAFATQSKLRALCVARPQEGTITKEKALAGLVEARHSRFQYNVIRNSTLDRFPSYFAVQLGEIESVPSAKSMVIIIMSQWQKYL